MTANLSSENNQLNLFYEHYHYVHAILLLINLLVITDKMLRLVVRMV